MDYILVRFWNVYKQNEFNKNNELPQHHTRARVVRISFARLLN